MLGVYVVLAVATVGVFKLVPQRLRAGAGQAVPDRLRAAARRRHARPHRGGDPPHERHRAQAARRRARDRVPGPVDQRLHQQLELGHRLRLAEALRPAQGARTCRAGAIAQQPERPVRRRSRTPSSRSSRRRRCRAWARPAASSCSSRTAPRSASTRSTPRRRPSWPRPTQAPELAGMFSSCQVNVPQLYADIDRTKARQLGVPVTDVFDTMQIYLGSLYANDFNKFGRTYSVRVQADAAYRARAEDIGAAQGALDERRDGAAVGADEGHADLRPGARDALQRLPHRRHQRRRRRRASRRARRRTRSSASPPRRCRPASPTSGPT